MSNTKNTEEIVGTELGTSPDNDEEPIRLENLLEIEDPKMRGKLVDVDAIISSNNIPYSVPTHIQVDCNTDSENHAKYCPRSKLIELKDEDKPEFTEIKAQQKAYTLKHIAQKYAHFANSCILNFEEKKHTTIKRLRIRPIVSSLIKKSDGFFDDSGNEWKAYDIYVEQDEIQKLEAGKEFNFVGRIVPDAKNQRIALYIKHAKETQNTDYDQEKIDKLRDYFAEKPIDGIVSWITDEFVYYSKIIGRQDVTFCYLLAFFSILHLEFDKGQIIGWLKNIAVGDSTVGKSETAKKLITLLGGGQMITGELSSQAGIGATATQGSNNTWFVDFGALVLQDRKLLVIDGAHKLKKTHWDQLSEAEREGKITIMKAAKGEAYARTRTIKIMNPVGEDLTTTQTMNSFYYPVIALKNNFQIQNIARIDLAVFVMDDISPEDRNTRIDREPDGLLSHLSDLLKLVWANKFAVSFDEAATAAILEHSTLLEKKFKHEEIPLISNDIKYKLARLSAALAALCCSFTDGYGKLIVRPEHVEYIVKYVTRQYTTAGLNSLSQNTDVIDEETVADAVSDVQAALEKLEPPKTDQECQKILVWMGQQAKFTRDLLSTQFEIPQNNGIRPLVAKLQNNRLLKQSNRGLAPTKKLIQITKLLNTSNSLITAKNGYPHQQGGSQGPEGGTSFGLDNGVSRDKDPNTAENDMPPSTSLDSYTEDTDDGPHVYWICSDCHQDTQRLISIGRSDSDGKSLAEHQDKAHNTIGFTARQAQKFQGGL